MQDLFFNPSRLEYECEQEFFAYRSLNTRQRSSASIQLIGKKSRNGQHIQSFFRETSHTFVTFVLYTRELATGWLLKGFRPSLFSSGLIKRRSITPIYLSIDLRLSPDVKILQIKSLISKIKNSWLCKVPFTMYHSKVCFYQAYFLIPVVANYLTSSPARHIFFHSPDKHYISFHQRPTSSRRPPLKPNLSSFSSSGCCFQPSPLRWSKRTIPLHSNNRQ